MFYLNGYRTTRCELLYIVAQCMQYNCKVIRFDILTIRKAASTILSGKLFLLKKRQVLEPLQYISVAKTIVVSVLKSILLNSCHRTK